MGTLRDMITALPIYPVAKKGTSEKVEEWRSAHRNDFMVTLARKVQVEKRLEIGSIMTLHAAQMLRQA